MVILLETFDPFTTTMLAISTGIVGIVTYRGQIFKLLSHLRKKCAEDDVLVDLMRLHRELCFIKGLPLNSSISRVASSPQFSTLRENVAVDQYGSLIITCDPWECVSSSELTTS